MAFPPRPAGVAYPADSCAYPSAGSGESLYGADEWAQGRAARRGAGVNSTEPNTPAVHIILSTAFIRLKRPPGQQDDLNGIIPASASDAVLPSSLMHPSVLPSYILHPPHGHAHACYIVQPPWLTVFALPLQNKIGLG